MKSRFRLILLVSVTTSATMSTAVGQPGRGQGNRLGGDSPNDPSYLLASQSVQKELALSDEQKEKLEKIWDDEQNGARDFFRGFIGLSQDQIQKRIDQRARATRKKLGKILSTEQMTRLNEINVQVAGIAALTFDAVVEKLELSPEQQKDLLSIDRESRRKLADLYATANRQPPAAEGHADRRKQHDTIMAERTTASLAVLTDAQKATFEKLQGKKFDVTTIRPRSRNFTNRVRIEPPIVVPGRVPG